MIGPSQNFPPSERERSDGARGEGFDIFACVADTRKQLRPPRFPSNQSVARELAVNHAAAFVQDLLEALPAVAPLPGGTPSVDLPKPVHVLLADDDPLLQHILGYQLANLSWEVTCSGDGLEVEELLQRGGIDVLLIDLNLPHRNAYEILEKLGNGATRPRVIVMSAQAQEDTIVRAFEHGADDFVQKPLNPRVVVSRIRRWVDHD